MLLRMIQSPRLLLRVIKMKETDKLINVRQASEILGIKPVRLYQWKYTKQHLPFVKVGKALRISMEDLMTFIEKRKKHPAK